MIFDYERLMRIASRKEYRQAVPFPHVLIDHASNNEEFLLKCVKEFPEPGPAWTLHGGPTDQKLEGHHYPLSIKAVLEEMNSEKFCDFLHALTDEPEIMADNAYAGGGMHLTTRGGFLKIHMDFNVADNKKRILNVILFLNPDWKDEYGGHLEFWNKDMTKCEMRTMPEFNRLVVFSISDTSWHGHPDPLKVDGRKSLATYYYRKIKEGEKIEPHSTIYMKRPGEKW